MKTVTMLEFRKDAEGILRRVGKGERFVLSHRGRPAARLEPVETLVAPDPVHDLFLGIARRATRSPKGKTAHQDIDRILYADHHFQQAGFTPLLDNRPRHRSRSGGS